MHACLVIKVDSLPGLPTPEHQLGVYYHLDALNVCRSLHEDMQHELHFGLHVMGRGSSAACMKVMCIFSPVFTGHALACMSYTAKTPGLLSPHF